MIRGCDDPDFPSYKSIGAKGITYNPCWISFAYFLKDMGNMPDVQNGLRRTNEGVEYTKSNCYWGEGKPGRPKKDPRIPKQKKIHLKVFENTYANISRQAYLRSRELRRAVTANALLHDFVEEAFGIKESQLDMFEK